VFRRQFVRDRRTHRLVARAEGYESAEVRFVDEAPRSRMVLRQLPSPVRTPAVPAAKSNRRSRARRGSSVLPPSRDVPVVPSSQPEPKLGPNGTPIME